MNKLNVVTLCSPATIEMPIKPRYAPFHRIPSVKVLDVVNAIHISEISNAINEEIINQRDLDG